METPTRRCLAALDTLTIPGSSLTADASAVLTAVTSRYVLAGQPDDPTTQATVGELAAASFGPR